MFLVDDDADFVGTDGTRRGGEEEEEEEEGEGEGRKGKGGGGSAGSTTPLLDP